MGFLTQSDLVWRISIGVAAVSYLAMAFAGAYVIYRRRDYKYNALAVLFVLLLLGGGITRTRLTLRSIPPLTADQRYATVFNGAFSLCMAMICLWMIPAAMKMVSRQELENINRSLRDEVDARNQAEHRLQQLVDAERAAGEAKIRSYFEAASQGILAVSSEGRIVLVNRRTEEMFGYTRTELLGQPLEMLLPERLRAAHSVHRQGYFAEPRMRAMGASMELAGRRKDATEFPVEIGLSSVEADEGILALGLVSDITDRVRAAKQLASTNAELRAREAQLQSYLEAASQSIIAISSDGCMVMVNRRTEELFGYSREEMLGHGLEMLLPERFRHAHSQQVSGFFAAPRLRPMGAPGLNLVGRRKDGTEFPAEIGLSFVETDEGRLTLSLISDITERKRAADDLARLNTELRRSNSELEQFAYLASHDLQEPLRMVTSYLTLLDRRYRDRLDGDALEFIDFAVSGATRMKGLIKDVLRFSRVGAQPIRLEEVPAEKIVQDALNNLNAAIEERNAEIAVGPMPSIVADAGLLTQVIQNLVGNAIKFTKDRKPRVRISVTEGNRESIFSVIDNGIGIEPNHVDRIFRIFERLNAADNYPGTGVGLAIAKKVIELHGGRIWVESNPGEGSVFHFSLPAKSVSVSPESKAAKA